MLHGDENKLWKLSKQERENVDVLAGFKIKSLPPYGWLDTCYFCSAVTSKVKILTYKNVKYYVFRCKDCINCILTL